MERTDEAPRKHVRINFDRTTGRTVFLDGRHFEQCQFNDCDISSSAKPHYINSKVEDTRLEYTTFADCVFEKGDIASLYECVFTRCVFKDTFTCWYEPNFERCEFKECTFSHASMLRASFVDVIFTDC